MLTFPNDVFIPLGKNKQRIYNIRYIYTCSEGLLNISSHESTYHVWHGTLPKWSVEQLSIIEFYLCFPNVGQTCEMALNKKISPFMQWHGKNSLYVDNSIKKTLLPENMPRIFMHFMGAEWLYYRVLCTVKMKLKL